MQGPSSRRGVSLHCRANAKARGEAAVCLLGHQGLATALWEAGSCPCGWPSPAGGTSSVWLRDSGWQLRGVETSGRPTRGLCGSSWQGLDKGGVDAPSHNAAAPRPSLAFGPVLLPLPKPNTLVRPGPWQLRNVKRCLSLSKWPEGSLALRGVGTMEPQVRPAPDSRRLAGSPGLQPTEVKGPMEAPEPVEKSRGARWGGDTVQALWEHSPAWRGWHGWHRWQEDFSAWWFLLGRRAWRVMALGPARLLRASVLAHPPHLSRCSWGRERR